MATRQTRARTPTRSSSEVSTAPNPAPFVPRRIVMDYIDINDIVPYDWNPRDNSKAVQSVANSIRLTHGMAQPVLLDADNVLVAGHTRVEACKSLGITEVPYVRLAHLTQDEINAFRIIDHKVAEAAEWDHAMLASEINKLESAGIAWTDYNFTQADIDCMAQLVADDCLNTDTLAPVAQAAATTATRNAASRAPARARFVLGEIVFYLDINEYRPWVTGVRELCGFDEGAIAAEIMRRLGITD
jgi:hypothetical protein